MKRFFLVLTFSSAFCSSSEYTVKEGRLYDSAGLPVETLARAAIKLNTTRDVIAELATEKVENYEYISRVAYPMSRAQYEKAKYELLMQLFEKD